VRTRLRADDWLGTARARLGVNRTVYRVAPGLYAAGAPGPDSPVLVTASYKLSFDALRGTLGSMSAWILVLDTRGVNVWCAAGKKTFSTDELVHRIEASSLARVTPRRELILPQLGATGVCARELRRRTGFSVLWGPIRASDLPGFLAAGQQATPAMRRASFTFSERLVLAPVELYLFRKTALWLALCLLLLSALGLDVFTWATLWQRWLWTLTALGAGVLGGAVLLPALLPWIPGRAFAWKGALLGLLCGLWPALSAPAGAGWLERIALILFTVCLSSYLAMNFTGSTPYTSPSGVEREMRRAMPAQAVALFLALGGWIWAGLSG